jgi:hypothetical protein
MRAMIVVLPVPGDSVQMLNGYWKGCRAVGRCALFDLKPGRLSRMPALSSTHSIACNSLSESRDRIRAIVSSASTRRDNPKKTSVGGSRVEVVQNEDDPPIELHQHLKLTIINTRTENSVTSRDSKWPTGRMFCDRLMLSFPSARSHLAANRWPKNPAP